MEEKQINEEIIYFSGAVMLLSTRFSIKGKHKTATVPACSTIFTGVGM